MLKSMPLVAGFASLFLRRAIRTVIIKIDRRDRKPGDPIPLPAACGNAYYRDTSYDRAGQIIEVYRL
jgi:hypothetical protein